MSQELTQDLFFKANPDFRLDNVFSVLYLSYVGGTEIDEKLSKIVVRRIKHAGFSIILGLQQTKADLALMSALASLCADATARNLEIDEVNVVSWLTDNNDEFWDMTCLAFADAFKEEHNLNYKKIFMFDIDPLIDLNFAGADEKLVADEDLIIKSYKEQLSSVGGNAIGSIELGGRP